jgi:hypothetical protein
MPTFRKSTLRDCFELAPKLRPSDLAELTAAGSPSALAALMSGLTNGTSVTVAGDGDEPLMMFGVVPDPRDNLVGFIWALASTQATKHRRMFLTDAPKWVEMFQKQFPILTNFTDCRNREHHRWLQWSGFAFINRKDGPTGQAFYEFVRIRSDNV